MNNEKPISRNFLNKKKINLFFNQKQKKKIQIKKIEKNIWKLVIILLLIICLILVNFFFNIKNYTLTEIPTRNELIFIVCMFGKDTLKSDHRLRRYFYTLNTFLPHSNIVLAVSEFTIIEPDLINYQNINISVEKYRNETFENIRRKYRYNGAGHFYYSGMRSSFYVNYLKEHPEIKYVVISDDDTLFFRDPFQLIVEDPSAVHIMEDIYPFSKTNDGNYKWTNAWVELNNSTKLRCGFKVFNNTLLSNEIKDLIPLNSGLMIGTANNIIKLNDLISSRFLCSGMFPENAEQGLLNYLDLSGELKELDFPIHRHNLYNGSLLSCPDLLPIENYTQQINSDHIIAVHHYNNLGAHYIKQSPILFQTVFNIKF